MPRLFQQRQAHFGQKAHLGPEGPIRAKGAQFGQRTPKKGPTMYGSPIRAKDPLKGPKEPNSGKGPQKGAKNMFLGTCSSQPQTDREIPHQFTEIWHGWPTCNFLAVSVSNQSARHTYGISFPSASPWNKIFNLVYLDHVATFIAQIMHNVHKS